MGWSHDAEKKNNAYNDQQMLDYRVNKFAAILVI